MHFQKLYTDIFSAPGEDPENVSMLKKVSQEYPYFSLAHFFLLKKAIESGEDIETIASKTALHFNNPYLLNEQLHKAAPPTNGMEKSETHEEEEVTKEPVLAIPEIETLPISSIISEEVPETKVPLGEETGEAEIKEELPVSNLPVNDKAAEPVAGEKQKEEAPLFEPLFASDYFASQGIKLTEEQQPTDRMGKQLKSFTEWLKTMKKVHDPKLPSTETPVDITVQKLAEKSNKEEEVITEAMAEVFLQQGKTNKAKEIYEKLSLLNPSKSAYFAAKLEQIK